MATEILRPTDAYNPGGWSTPANIWDGNTGTGSSDTNLNETPSISVGGAAGGEATNSWSAKAETWTAATLNVNFGKTAGSNDTVNVEFGKYEVGSYTKIADLVPSTSGGIAQQTFQATLTEADFGSGFVDIANLRVRVNGDKQAAPDGAVSTLYEVWVDGTYTVASIYDEAITLVSSSTAGSTAALMIDGVASMPATMVAASGPAGSVYAPTAALLGSSVLAAGSLLVMEASSALFTSKILDGLGGLELEADLSLIAGSSVLPVGSLSVPVAIALPTSATIASASTLAAAAEGVLAGSPVLSSGAILSMDVAALFDQIATLASVGGAEFDELATLAKSHGLTAETVLAVSALATLSGISTVGVLSRLIAGGQAVLSSNAGMAGIGVLDLNASSSFGLLATAVSEGNAAFTQAVALASGAGMSSGALLALETQVVLANDTGVITAGSIIAEGTLVLPAATVQAVVGGKDVGETLSLDATLIVAAEGEALSGMTPTVLRRVPVRLLIKAPGLGAIRSARRVPIRRN